jgi:hypothetical protein
MNTRIVFDVDRDGWTKNLQLNIATLDENDRGMGFRLAGPKYNGSSKNLLRTELDERDATEIRAALDAVFPLPVGPACDEVLRDELEQRNKDLEPYEVLNPQQCPAGLHADWLVDSEYTHTCPWCELDRLRAELAARPSRAKVLRQEADEIVAYCPDHTGGDMSWTDCHCDVADDMRRRANKTEAGTPAP